MRPQQLATRARTVQKPHRSQTLCAQWIHEPAGRQTLDAAGMHWELSAAVCMCMGEIWVNIRASQQQTSSKCLAV